MANWERRLEVLRDAHKHQHKVVEALIAENAPEVSITEAKIKKLHIKDEIAKLESEHAVVG